MRIQLSKHFSSADIYPNREAVIYHNADKKIFEVEFWEKDQLIENREMVTDGVAHSERYAEDAAENWCLGYIP